MRKTAYAIMFCLLCICLLCGSAYAFTYGDWDCYENEDGKTISISYQGSSTRITVPNSINGKSVVSVTNDSEWISPCYYYAELGSQAAKALSKGYGFTLPGYDDVRLRYAFYQNADGTYSWTTQWLEVFEHDKNITTANIPANAGITIIAQGGFQDCDQLTRVVIPEGITHLFRGAFSDCDQLEEVVFSDSLTEIRMESFLNCPALTEVHLHDHITSIDSGGDGVFSGANPLLYAGLNTETAYCISRTGGKYFNLEGYPEVNLVYWFEDETVTGLAASRHEREAENVVIPEGVTAIQAYGFNDCPNLTNIQFPTTLRIIQECAFGSCPNLLYLDLPEGLTEIQSQILQYGSENAVVVVPGSVTTIAGKAFRYFPGKVIMGCSSYARTWLNDDDSYPPDVYEFRHTEVILQGYPATATEPGLTDGIQCSACHEILTAQEEIPPYGNTVTITSEYFPDPAFRAYVSEQFDSDHDGALSEEERMNAEMVRVGVPDEWIEEGNCTAEEAAYIREHYQGAITSLKGIEYLTGLRWLHAVQMTALSGTLDVSANQALESIVVFESGLSGLILGNLPNLDNIHAEDNPLSSLDVSGCPKLAVLICRNCGLTNLDVSNNVQLKDLDCMTNAISSLDVSNLTALESLLCGENHISSLNVRNCPELSGLGCENNELTELDVSRNTKLVGLWTHENHLTEIDVTRNTQLEILNVWENLLTDIDVSHNTMLRELYVEWNQLTELDVSALIHLETLECMSNQISSLDLRNLSELTQLYCYTNLLTELDVSHNNKLLYLLIQNNKISSLNLGNQPKLEVLSFFYNPLYTLDISGCPKLVETVQNAALDDSNSRYDLYEYEHTADVWYTLVLPKGAVITTNGDHLNSLVLPASLTEIEAEAFSGIAADIIVIPSGCTTVGSRAFADCPNLKTVYIPSAASVATDAFEGCGDVQVVRTE